MATAKSRSLMLAASYVWRLFLSFAVWITPMMQATGSTPPRGADVLHYAADLALDIGKGHVTGRVTIILVGVAPSTTELVFDAGELQVERVVSDGQSLPFEKIDSHLHISLSDSVEPGETRSLTIDYRGAPRFGLEFHPGREEAYTIFSTSQWLVCVDAPDERATLDLTLRLPVGLTAAGTGREVSVRRRHDGEGAYRWRLDTPMPSYVYGFAAGRYTESSGKVGGIQLRYLSAERSREELQEIFRKSADMLRFFQKRAGLPYRGGYSQVLVSETIGQELAGLSLMSEAYGLRVLDDPTNVALMAHEAAHQWWGNRLTNRDWNHFWLNEGFANFMAAAYMEHRFGKDAYTRQVDGWHQRLEKLRGDGKDRPLVYDNWEAPTADDRAVVYQKGAYVLHLLRESLGERAFWRGIRRYTRANADRSVVTDDFKLAMEEASGKDLTDFFRQWIYWSHQQAP